MLQNAALLSRIQPENQSSSLNPAQSAEVIQLSGMSDENGDKRLVLDSTQHPRRTDCEYTMLNQCTKVSPTSYVKDLQLRGCWHLMPYNQCLVIGTPWVPHTLSNRYVTVRNFTPFRPVRRHFETWAWQGVKTVDYPGAIKNDDEYTGTWCPLN